MKFGGTSVADALAMRRVINIIKCNLEGTAVVIVSAIAGATNVLTKVYHGAVAGELEKCHELVAFLMEQHGKIVRELLCNELVQRELLALIDCYAKEIYALIRHIILRQPKAPSLQFAKLVAYGELLSSAIMQRAMEAYGIPTELVDAREVIITDDDYCAANPLWDEISNAMVTRLKYNQTGYVMLTQGFIGATAKGITTILGREGSDYSAAIIAAAIDAREVQIWTDVDGVMTADPRSISHPRLLSQLSFAEAEELSYFGAKVIHPLTMGPIAKKNIPLRILNSFDSPAIDGGTVVCNVAGICTKALACREEIRLLKIVSKQGVDGVVFQRQIDNWLRSLTVAPDFVNLSSTVVRILFFNDIAEENPDAQLEKIAHWENITSQGLICVLGENLTSSASWLASLKVKAAMPSTTGLSLILLVPRNQLWTIAQTIHGIII